MALLTCTVACAAAAVPWGWDRGPKGTAHAAEQKKCSSLMDLIA